jgi:hypothetical protein
MVGAITSDAHRHDNLARIVACQQAFLEQPYWGVGTTTPFGNDGRTINLTEVILQHRGEGQKEVTAFACLEEDGRRTMLNFLQSLRLFPPDDTTSTLDPGNPRDPAFPQKDMAASG